MNQGEAFKGPLGEWSPEGSSFAPSPLKGSLTLAPQVLPGEPERERPAARFLQPQHPRDQRLLKEKVSPVSSREKAIRLTDKNKGCHRAWVQS